MIQCPVCQVSNDDNSQFCRECGNRIERRSEPRPKLKSPLLSGYEEPDTYEDEPNVSKLRGVKPAKPKAPGEKTKLRSPLLHDDDIDDDDSWEAPKEERRPQSLSGKTKLRSPLLGEGDDDDDYDTIPPSGGGMPRVRRKPAASSMNPATDPQGSTGGQTTGNQGAKGAKPKLRSRLLDTSDYEEYDDDWDEDENFEDNTALRSPLLRARTHPDDKPEKSQVQTTPPAPQPMPQPMPQPAPQPAPPPPPAPAPPPPPNPQPLSVQQQQQQHATPPQAAPAHSQNQGSFAQQPTFQPPNLPAPTPEVPNQKPLQTPGQPQDSYLPPPQPQREATPPIPHPAAASLPERRNENRRKPGDRRLKSGLLGGGGAADDDEDEDFSNPRGGRQAGPQIGAEQLKIVFMASVCGVIFKVIYLGFIVMSFGIGGTALWMIFDQLVFIFVCIGLIMYSSQSMSSR